MGQVHVGLAALLRIKRQLAFLFPSGASGSGGQGKRPSLLRGHGPQGQYPLQPQVPRGASCAGTACTPTDQSSHRAPATALGPQSLSRVTVRSSGMCTSIGPETSRSSDAGHYHRAHSPTPTSGRWREEVSLTRWHWAGAGFTLPLRRGGRGS